MYGFFLNPNLNKPTVKKFSDKVGGNLKNDGIFDITKLLIFVNFKYNNDISYFFRVLFF